MAEDNVTYLDRRTTLPVPVARVLAGAQDCTAILVMGTAADGSFYVASSTADGPQLLWWLETCKHGLLAGEYA